MTTAARSKHRLVTAEELLRMGDGRRELIHGRVVEMSPAGWIHGVIVIETAARLWAFVRKSRLGAVCANDTGFQLERDPDHVLAPDVAFVRGSRVIRLTGFPPWAPDLAVEVLSPRDTLKAANEKAEDWLAHGTLEVWIVDPRRRNAIIHRQGLAPARIPRTGALTSPDLLPGFRLRLRDLFACLD